MAGNRIGVGLVGVGRHGTRYVHHLVHDLPMAALTAVCRRHPEQSVSLPGAESVNVYGEAQALLADPSVDVVVIVTPPIYSPDICQLAVRARKPILIEKPLATTASDARTMVAVARDAGVPLMTAQTIRFDKTIEVMKQLQQSVGRSQHLDIVFHIEKRKTAPDHAAGYGSRGALVEIGVHMLDLVRFLTGEEAREVRCTMDQCPPMAPELNAVVQLSMSGGTTCQIDIARVVGERAGYATWMGSGGRMEVDWIHRRIQCVDHTGEETASAEPPPSQTVLSTLQAFLQAVQDGTPIPITGEDGYRAVEIAEACYQSAQGGGVPVVLPLSP